MRAVRLALVGLVGGSFAYPVAARAHEKWFVDFTAWMGIPMSDQLFVLCAGSTELLIGLCLAFGFFPRLIVATAWVFINMTLTIFDWVELVGHLPLYGVMAVLLVWTPAEAEQRLWVRGVLGLDLGERAMKTFGASAPLIKKLQKKFGFEPDRVAAVANDLPAGR
jgi:uncharacterized membrane protein YphA (DoxX/SURF4 family)